MKGMQSTILLIGLASLFAKAQTHADPMGYWDALLSNYVSTSGEVNYRGLRQETAKLDQYLEHLSRNMPAPAWSREARMAWWINAYNAFTVKRVLAHYPLRSMMDIDGGKTWDTPWIKLGGKVYSLNQLEHEILRKEFRDPRIHFALNCAARSCPPLLNRAWTAANLEDMLERQARAFIRDKRYNRIAEGELLVSRIFDWYREDFGDLRLFLQRYSAVKIRPDARLDYMAYDWRLNEAAP
jgi:hypothetical protein